MEAVASSHFVPVAFDEPTLGIIGMWRLCGGAHPYFALALGETMLRGVVGEDGWEALPEPVRDVFTANGPAIVAEERGGFLDVTVEQLATIAQPTLLVAGRDSLPGFAEATGIVASAIPGAEVEWVEGGHLINPAHPAVLRFVDDVLALR